MSAIELLGDRSSIGPSTESVIPGFFVGGFECSSHRTPSGRRLDLSSSTRHVEFAEADYRRLADVGIRVARDGFAWHRVEAARGQRDFASVIALMRAARRAGVRVVWDLLHFGWPDDLDVFTPVFVDRFAALARDFAKVLADESDEQPWISPVNEISFVSWAAADVACIHPLARNRGFELKCQLVRAAIAAIEAVRDVQPATRIVTHDPAFNVIAAHDRPEDVEAAEVSRLHQFQACDMLCGTQWPQLGGRPDYLDVIGVNYYPWNQWTYGTALYPGVPIGVDDPRYRPLGDILLEWQSRYRRPTYVGETGCEGDRRAAWLRTVCNELASARERGADLHGVCLYPIVNFPGWDDDRLCENGLWGYANDAGERALHEPLAAELRLQQRRFGQHTAGDPPREAANAPTLDPQTTDTTTNDRWVRA